MGLFLAADAVSDASITLPWFAWVAVGTALVSAVVWLAKTYRASVESTNAQMVSLVREVVGAMAANTASLQEVLEAVKESRRV
jgi:hypothetical protein